MPNDIPIIEVFRHSDGNIYSINNRRLYAFKMAGIDSVPVKWVSRNSMRHKWTGNGINFYLRK